jgi:hypothetical protein
MSRLAALIVSLLLCASCSLFDEESSTEEEEEESSSAARWVKDLEPLLEADQALEEDVLHLALQVNCGQGPASVDTREKVKQSCAEANPGGGPVEAASIVQILNEDLIPQADELARELEKIEQDDEEIEALHKELLAHWQDRVMDFEDILDAWTAKDGEALDLAFDERLRHRRAAGEWLMRANRVLAEEGLQLGI